MTPTVALTTSFAAQKKSLLGLEESENPELRRICIKSLQDRLNCYNRERMESHLLKAY